MSFCDYCLLYKPQTRWNLGNLHIMTEPDSDQTEKDQSWLEREKQIEAETVFN